MLKQHSGRINRRTKLTAGLLLLVTFLMSCAQTDQRLQDAGVALGEARADPVITLPQYCRMTSRAGIEEGDDYLTAIGKYDAALTQQNQRTLSCARWFDEALL